MRPTGCGRLAGVALAVATLLVAAAGCGVTDDPLASAVDELTSSARSASLAVQLHAEGRTTSAAVRTQLDDATQDASDALRQTASLEVRPDQVEPRYQALRVGADTLDLLHRASDLVRAGRDVPRRTVARLDEVANRLALVSAEARGVPSRTACSLPPSASSPPSAGSSTSATW